MKAQEVQPALKPTAGSRRARAEEAASPGPQPPIHSNQCYMVTETKRVQRKASQSRQVADGVARRARRSESTAPELLILEMRSEGALARRPYEVHFQDLMPFYKREKPQTTGPDNLDVVWPELLDEVYGEGFLRRRATRQSRPTTSCGRRAYEKVDPRWRERGGR